jgi:small subunit ribosomal protein S7
MEEPPNVVEKGMRGSEDLPATFQNLIALEQMRAIAEGKSEQVVVEGVGHKFGLPTLPIPPTSNIKHRYDPIVAQVIGLLMRHGKLGVAQRVSSSFLFPQAISRRPILNRILSWEPY